MLLESVPSVQSAGPAPAAKPSAATGAPLHCQTPMSLVSEPATPDSGASRGLLEWRCACGLRMDAGMIPLPFTVQTAWTQPSAA
jgi:hypothetical protein